jgi:hypothetical protein
MQFAPHYIEACQPAQPLRAETRRHTLSSVELGLVAELAARDRLELPALAELLARRDASAEPSLVTTLRDLPDLATLLARQARRLQIEAEAMFAALLVRERIAGVDWITRTLAARAPRSPWLGVSLLRDGLLAEADLPWLFETRRVLHGRAQAWQADGFLAAIPGSTSLPAELDRWLVCPRDPAAPAFDLLARAIPRAVALLADADLDAKSPARGCDAELPHEGLVFGYRILQPISHGSRGVVYRARHLFTGRDVALKIVPLRHPNNFGRAAELWREAVAMSRVQDPRVLTTYDFGGCKEYYYYASELLAGRALDRTELTPTALLGCARDVALALCAIRDAGLVHRDVIPANILVGDDGITRLLDYGDVGFHSDVRVPGRGVPGTIPYIAPEEILAANVDDRSDQYMLGVVLFELLSGRRLFAGGEQEFKDWAQTAVVPTLRSLVPEIAPALDALVERMTRARPEDRFQSLDELIAAIDRSHYSAVNSVLK